MRKRTKRKHYPAVPMLDFVLEGVRMMSATKAEQLRAIELAALESFRTGPATVDDWRTLADVVNLSETLAEMGVGREEVTPSIQAVEQHLAEAHARYGRTGRIGTTGPGLQAMQDLCEYHHLQRTAVDVATMERAIQRTQQRIASAHPSVKVYVSPQGAAA